MKRHRLKGGRRSHFVKYDVKHCRNLEKTDIFLVHEAPSGIGLVKREKDVGIDVVREIVENIKPKMVFFGHHHEFLEAKIGRTKVYGLGYARDGYFILDTQTSEIQRTFRK